LFLLYLADRTLLLSNVSSAILLFSPSASPSNISVLYKIPPLFFFAVGPTRTLLIHSLACIKKSLVFHSYVCQYLLNSTKAYTSAVCHLTEPPFPLSSDPPPPLCDGIRAAGTRRSLYINTGRAARFRNFSRPGAVFI